MNTIERLWTNLPWPDYEGNVFATIIPYNRGFLGFATEKSKWDFGLHMQPASPQETLDDILASFRQSVRGQCFVSAHGSTVLDFVLTTNGQAHILIYCPMSANGKVEWQKDGLVAEGFTHDHPACRAISSRPLLSSSSSRLL